MIIDKALGSSRGTDLCCVSEVTEREESFDPGSAPGRFFCISVFSDEVSIRERGHFTTSWVLVLRLPEHNVTTEMVYDRPVIPRDQSEEGRHLPRTDIIDKTPEKFLVHSFSQVS